MALKRITEEEMNAQGVIAAPDILNGTPAQNKAIFDRMVRSLVAPAVNACVDAVEEVNQNETEKNLAEQERKTAEAGRVEAEKGRVAAEQARVDSTNGIVAQATEQAQAAKASADGARALAAAAAESAANADNSAVAAADSASDAAESSGSASDAAEAARAAQAAAEKARDEAQGAVGGDFATKTEVSDRIKAHNESTSAHSDIRVALDGKAPMLKLRHNLTGAGWFRVGLINTDGASSSVTRVAVGALYSNVYPSTVVMDIMRVHMEAHIHQQAGVVDGTGITQVRVCNIDWKTLALDVYVTTPLENPYNFTIMPIMGSFTPSSFENVTSSTDTVSASITLTDGGSYAPAYTYGTTDLTAGSSPLATGQLHFVYE